MNVFFVSLGCDKNLVDSEVMLGILNREGYQIVDQEEEADVIVVNTCCFIHDAKEESIETILECAQYKKTGRLQVLVVTGCLAQRYKDDILAEIPEVDVVLGSSSYDEIAAVIRKAVSDKQKITLDKGINYLSKVTGGRIGSAESYCSYLKIAEGCDKHCTYCIIPKLRGSYRSIPMEDVLANAKELAQNGAVELNLVAQEITVYGVDLYGKKMLPTLLKKLCEIEEIKWIRLLYCYPEEITEELIDVMAEEEKICHYIDMPIQHSEDAELKRMGRRTSKAELVQVIQHLRERIPDIAIRTTLITGFPGETEEEFEAVYRFVNEREFDRLGVYPDSMEEGTAAAELPDQIPEQTRQQRRAELMELQQAISYENDEKMVGKTIPVLIEGYLYEDDIYVGRSYKDAKGVDGNVFVSSEEELISGTIVPVKITDFKEYDLIGERVYEFTK